MAVSAIECDADRWKRGFARDMMLTQELGDDPAQVMMRQVIALFDEYQSKENAKHTLRAMRENARQGYWNGARPPFGYQTIEAEKRGARVKKKLAVDDVEAETVRLVYRLFMEGERGSGPMGVKSITVWLNEHGYRTRQGGCWGVAVVHKMLSNPVYGGECYFDVTNARTGCKKDKAEHIRVEVPGIIAPTEFAQVQALLKSRNPRVTPPRVVTGPILLTGLAFCAFCGGAMTLRTGTSKTGVVYRYYACSTCERKGKMACRGKSIRMDRLDTLVTETIAERLLQPERIADMLSLLGERRAKKAASVDDRIARLEKEANQGQERLQRLYRFVEEGAELDDLLRERIAALKSERERTLAALERARSVLRPELYISPALIDRFAETMREKLCFGEIPMRKAYLASIIDRIEVDAAMVRIMGHKDAIEQGVMHAEKLSNGVRSFVPKWRTGEDSNSRPPDS